MTIQEAIKKHFRDEKILYFRQSDLHAMIEGETYIRYEKDNGILLWFGGNNGEVCILVTKDGDLLDKIISLIL